MIANEAAEVGEGEGWAVTPESAGAAAHRCLPSGRRRPLRRFLERWGAVLCGLFALAAYSDWKTLNGAWCLDDKVNGRALSRL